MSASRSLSRTQTTFPSPIVESRRWLQEANLPEGLHFLNLSQAAPADPPPEGLRKAMAEAALAHPHAHLYGAVLGRTSLRAALAHQMSDHYAAKITLDQIAITSGCNQAFAATIASLCGEGDEVILPTPWYFNHKMWLDMQGVVTVPLKVQDTMLPSTESCAALITNRTRAIVLVTPNNPCGVEYPEGLMERFYDLAEEHALTLIVDETYRDFDSRSGPPHQLFFRSGWDKTLVHLYSFSKAYRLTGHRIGAIATNSDRLIEVEKFLDTVTICPSQLGQIGAEWGLNNLGDWLAEERKEILARRAAIEDGFAPLASRGWRLLGAGAYFAYVEHPFPHNANALARRLLNEVGVLMLPGSMFAPRDDADAPRQFRIAFANVDQGGIRDVLHRLSEFSP
jgi:aspartate/methionine/tyrosine aminotransferase